MSVGSMVFDLDGTLVDHRSASSSAIKTWISRTGASTDAELALGVAEWTRLEHLYFSRYLVGEISFRDQRRGRMAELLAFLGRGSSHRLDALFDCYAELYEAAWIAFDDVVPALSVLRDLGYRICIFSNGERAQQERKVERTGLGDHIDGLITSSDLGMSKPEPAAFSAAWTALGLHKDRSCYVGDNLDVDVRAAAAAGIRGVWINRVRDRQDANDVVEIRSLDELGRMPIR